jgi:hypothetical protein
MERAGLEYAFGAHAASIPTAEFRSRIGHPLAASGPIDLGLILATRSASGRGVLCNSLGYSGQAATLAVLPEIAAA